MKLAGWRLNFPRSQWQPGQLVSTDPQPPLPLQTATHPVADGSSRLVAGAVHGRAYGSFAGKGGGGGGGSVLPVFMHHYRQQGICG